jgi:diguanylate cyclase (GGDEF)-like protein
MMATKSPRARPPIETARISSGAATGALAPDASFASSRPAAVTDDQPAEGTRISAANSRAARDLRGIIDAVDVATIDLARGLERISDDLRSPEDGYEHLGREGVTLLIRQLAASRLEIRQRLEEVSAALDYSRAQARIDPLTGCCNRRGMEEALVREIARARRNRTPLSFALLDIDHFKRINDRHGHDTGDRALVHLATLLQSALRETDLVCRMGGEEFVLVLPGAALPDAHCVVERLRKATERAPLVLPDLTVDLRFSAGVAEWTTGETQEDLIQRADRALYTAKHAGRNQVHFAAPAPAAAA